jgi:hypothetical protein
MDPDNTEVLTAIERMSRQRRWVRGAAVSAGILAVAVGGFFLRENLRGAAPAEVAAEGEAEAAAAAERPTGVTPAGRARKAERAAVSGDRHLPEVVAARAPAVAHPTGPGPRRQDVAGKSAAASAPAAAKRGEGAAGVGGGGVPAAAPAGGGEPATAGVGARRFELSVFPRDSEYSIDGGPPRKIDGARALVEVGAGKVVLEVKNRCCVSQERIIPAGDRGGAFPHIDLEYKPGYVTPRCPGKRVSVTVNQTPWDLEREFTVPIEKQSMGTSQVRVSFLEAATGREDAHSEEVEYGEHKDVPCRF